MANLKRIILGIYAALCVLSHACSNTIKNDRQKRSINGGEIAAGEALMNSGVKEYPESAPTSYTFRVSMINYGDDPVEVSQHVSVPGGVEIRSFNLDHLSDSNRTRRRRSISESKWQQQLTQVVGGIYDIQSREKVNSEMTYINHPAEILDTNSKTFHKLATKIAVFGDNVVGGDISTPNYPENYPNGADISWLITYPEGNIIRLSILDYSTEECCDHVIVYDGTNKSASVLTTLDGKSSGYTSTITSTGQSLFLRFTSDCLVSARGFQASYVNTPPSNPNLQITTPTPMSCGSVKLESANAGFVLSPNYPGLYGSNMSCTWSVQTYYGTRVQFTVEDFYTQYYDRLYIYNGSPYSAGNSLAATLYGNVYSGYTVTVDSNKAFLVFETYSTSRGFNISYEGINRQQQETTTAHPSEETTALYFNPSCSGIEYLYDGSDIYSPGYYYPHWYPTNTYCQWRIQVAYGRVVQLHAHYFSIENGSDWVRFYEGYGTNSNNLIGEYTGNFSNHVNLGDSSSRYATVTFQSDSAGTARGFSMGIWTVAAPMLTTIPDYPTTPSTDATYFDPRQCYGVQYLTAYTSIASPGFYTPNWYPHDSDCQWRIQASNINAYLLFRVDSFSLEYRYDWVKIFEGYGISSSHELSFLTGFISRSTDVASTSTPYATLQFHSDGSVNDYGFKILVYSKFYASTNTTNAPEVTPLSNTSNICSGITELYGSTGFILSPGYPYYDYVSNLDCQYSIIAPYNTYIRMEIQSFSLAAGDYLYIFDGSSINNDSIAILAGSMFYGEFIYTSSSKAYLRFMTNSNSSSFGFNIRYDAEEVGYEFPTQSYYCGSNLYGSSGTITSPNYPGYYYNYLDCTWAVHVSSFSCVLFTVDYFETEEYYDYVNFYDGTPSYTIRPLYHNMTGEYGNTHIEILSTNSSAFLTFHSDYINTYRGFSIRYSAVSCSYSVITTTPPRIATTPIVVPTEMTTTWWRRESGSNNERKGDEKNVEHFGRDLWEGAKNRPKKNPLNDEPKP